MIYIQPLLYLEPEPSSPFSKFSTLSSSLRFAKIVNRVDEPSLSRYFPDGKKEKGRGREKNETIIQYTLSVWEILIAPLSN